jgi:hypothetical protein
MRVVDDRAAAQVEEVLAPPPVAGTRALPVAHVRQGMLHLHPLAQPRAAGRGLLALAQLDQQALVGMHGDAAPARAGGAARTEWAGGADGGGEVDGAPRREGQLDLLRTAQHLALPVQQEGRLGKREPLRTGQALQ